MRRGIAWVESPLQFLSAVEAFHADVFGRELLIRTRMTAIGMPAFMAAMRRLDLPAGITVREGKAHRADVKQGNFDVIGIGDVFSGVIQRVLSQGVGKASLVILDDGLATRTALAKLTAGPWLPLTRDRGQPSAQREILGVNTTRLLRRLAGKGRLAAFTAMTIDPQVRRTFTQLGSEFWPHTFDWLRGVEVEESFDEPIIMLGSAMAEDGLIDPERYRRWVERQSGGVSTRYFPHRRESEGSLARIAALPGMTVEHAGLPVEFRLRGLGPGHSIVCLPTTALASLRLLLPDPGPDIRAFEVPDEAWTAAAKPKLRRKLNETVKGSLA